MQLRYNHLWHLLQVSSVVAGLATPKAIPNAMSLDKYPTREVAGVIVVDTPIVRAAHDLAYEYSASYLYKHVMRSWLFGTLILANNASLAATVDPEIHAVSALLHDLGVAEGSPFISSEKRFEVDGAVAAREFVRNYTRAHAEIQGHWGDRSQQLVWDAIALHTQRSISAYKEPVVASTGDGIMLDFSGPDHGVSQSEYDAVTAKFPRDDFLETFNTTFVWLAETKPGTTYDTFQQPWGDYFVEGYSAVGHRSFDVIAGLHNGLVESK